MAAGDVTSVLIDASKRVGAFFDGVDDKLVFPTTGLQYRQLSGTPFTLCAWVYLYPRAGTTNHTIFNKNFNFAADQGHVWVVDDEATTGKQRVYSGNTTFDSTTAITRNVWHHLAVVFNTNSIQFYLDGAEDGLHVEAMVANSYGNNLRLGMEYDTANMFAGIISDFRLYNTALTTAEVLSIYNGLDLRRELLMHVKLDSDFNDSIANLTGTATGTFLTNNIVNKIISETNRINLAAVTDKLIVLPVTGRDRIVKVIKAERATA